MNLSEHFTLEELTRTEAGARLGLDNTPDDGVVANLTRIAATLEQVRRTLNGKPIHINSGYRSAAVNHAVGGAAYSAHLEGRACDFVCPEFGSPYLIALAIQTSGIAYDQLILEYGWVHLSVQRLNESARRIAMTKKSAQEPIVGGIIA